MAGIYLAGVAATYVQYILLNKIGQRTVTRMRTDLFDKMERLPIKYFDTHQHGDLMSRYTNDIDQVSNALTDSLSDMLSSALMLIGIFILMIYISYTYACHSYYSPVHVSKRQNDCKTK